MNGDIKTYAEVRAYCAGFQAAIDFLDRQLRSLTQALADRLRADAEVILREFEKEQRRPNRRRGTKRG